MGAGAVQRKVGDVALFPVPCTRGGDVSFPRDTNHLT